MHAHQLHVQAAAHIRDQSLTKLSKGVLEERLMNVEFFPILAIAP